MFAGAHKQGEHVSIVGPTGSGKSHAMIALCQIIAKRKGRDGRPTRVVIFGTKPQDSTLSRLVASGWPVIKKWPPSFGQEHCIVWPRGGTPAQFLARQRKVFGPLMGVIYQEGGQTLGIDEAGYFEEPAPNGLGLKATMGQYWTSARSLKLTLIAATQRPRHVTRSMWSEPSWVVIFQPEDEDDLARVAQLSGAKEQVIELAPQLGAHEFICVRRQRGESVKRLYISKVD